MQSVTELVPATEPVPLYFKLDPDMLVDRATFAAENAKMRAAGQHEATGVRANPVFLPAPHAVARTRPCCGRRSSTAPDATRR